MLTTALDSWKPRAYQAAGVKLMVSQACAGLFFPPGGGKTSCTYMALSVLKAQGYTRRALVICPLRPAYRVWPHQKDKYAEFTHLKVNLLHGKDKEAQLQDVSSDMCVINPEGLGWLFGAGLDSKGKMTLDPERVKFIKAHFDVLVVDESTKFKNPQTSRFKMLCQIVKYFKRRYILTGTPTPKGLMDLFGQMYILDEGQSLGSYITHFRTEYFYPAGFGGYDWRPQPDAMQRIGAKIAPYVMRINLEDAGIDLPELTFDDIWVDLPDEVRKLYNRMEDDLVAQVASGEIVAANAAVASSKCRQIANGSIFKTDGTWEHLHTAKLDALDDLVEQLQGDPLLVTYEFVPDEAAIAAKFKALVKQGRAACISTGRVKVDDLNIQKFSGGHLDLVWGQPQSISLGIDGLQDSCHHIAMFGVTWNLQDYLQVIDRVRRSGNKSKHVIVHRILARDTVDERVLRVLDERGQTQHNFMELLRRLRS